MKTLSCALRALRPDANLFLAHRFCPCARARAVRFYPCALRALRSDANAIVFLVYKRVFGVPQGHLVGTQPRGAECASLRETRFYPQKYDAFAANSVKHLRLYLT